MDIDEVYFDHGPQPGDQDATQISGNGLGVAKLKRSEETETWLLSSVSPFDFEEVELEEEDEETAISAAKVWLVEHFRREPGVAEAVWGDE